MPVGWWSVFQQINHRWGLSSPGCNNIWARFVCNLAGSGVAYKHAGGTTLYYRPALPSPLVLGVTPSVVHIVDRDQTVSRRSQPSSRTILIGEQPNPWNVVLLQDMMSRHRGAKQAHGYELAAPISLLSPAYLLCIRAE